MIAMGIAGTLSLVSILFVPTWAHPTSTMCGTNITSSTTQLIPRERCKLKIVIPPGKTAKIIVRPVKGLGTYMCPQDEKTVQIMNEVTGESHSLCHEADDLGYFSAVGGPFLMTLNQVPAFTELAIEYVQHVYGCNRKVKNALIGQTLEFRHTGGRTCALALPPNTRIQVFADIIEEDKCVDYDFSQGYDLFHMTSDTGNLCFGPEVATHDVYCTVGVLYHDGEQGDVLKVKILPISKDDELEFNARKMVEDC